MMVLRNSLCKDVVNIIVQYDVSLANSLIRSCSDFHRMITNDKQTMDIVCRQYYMNVHDKLQLEFLKVFTCGTGNPTSRYYLKYLKLSSASHQDDNNMDHYSTITFKYENWMKVESLWLRSFNIEVKNPVQKQAIDNIFVLKLSFQNCVKHVLLRKGNQDDNILNNLITETQDVLLNLEYILQESDKLVFNINVKTLSSCDQFIPYPIILSCIYFSLIIGRQVVSMYFNKNS